MNALHKCNIKEKHGLKDFYYDYYHRNERGLKILFSSSEELEFAFDREFHYSDWADFIKVIETMIAKIKKEGSTKLEARLKAEYEKRFGMPMTDFELSIEMVIFQYSLGKSPQTLGITLIRTTKGARIKYFSYDKDPNLNINLDLRFDISEWLDIVNALRKCHIDEWKKKHWEKKYWKSYENMRKEGFVQWSFRVYLLDKDTFYDENRLTFNYGDGFPPNWVEFKETMGSIAEKIREKAEISKKFQKETG